MKDYIWELTPHIGDADFSVNLRLAKKWCDDRGYTVFYNEYCSALLFVKPIEVLRFENEYLVELRKTHREWLIQRFNKEALRFKEVLGYIQEDA